MVALAMTLPLLPRMSAAEAMAILDRAGVAMTLSDPRLPDNPLVYVNEAFERVTGYAREEALGRNCRFLQGPGTDPDHVGAMREAIGAGREVTVDILNYRQDGTPFRNRLLIAPVLDGKGDVTHHLGIQKELSADEARRAVSREDALREVHHRVKNHLAMIGSLIRMEGRASAARDGFEALARRVDALQMLYEEMSLSGLGRRAGPVSLGPYLARVAEGTGRLDPRGAVRVSTDMAAMEAPAEVAARLGLVLSEVVTNAVEHAFEGRDAGHVAVRLERRPDGGARLAVRDDGRGLGAGARWPDMGSLGGRIVLGLVDGLGATLGVDTGPGGTAVTLDLPTGRLAEGA